ncbi:iron chaperone [Salinispora arenicola]|uniref:Uncharacterized protein YdhG (YjbR/CyaY superfamily) n=1 Tax=Salinispora arenicola TaxID=168697 RepID=A0A542XTD0_SALAC|nr:DUF1801 domain-containing protein [Salinispora arenicola]MCN0152004.1 DUF1801 domain-containing protein [Salinispora arenicola]TQL39099.1 uncharacterized protein YdhG (YjbR/CyaY superfamily) [Salinispora arenicola]GIM88006.1 hypothetical protein Sar04_47420 [Salinispora arenicola]
MANVVDKYLADLPAEQRAALQRLRDTIRSAAPQAEETIRSGVPAFRINNRPLVSIGAASNHLSLYIMYGDVLRTHADDLHEYDTSNTVVRYQPDKPLPDRLVTKLVKARLAEITD